MQWQTLAENLPLGHKTRSNCECGDGKTLVINHNMKGYSAHCFRCDFNGFVGKGKQTLAEIEKMNKLNHAAQTTHLKLELPHDYSTEIPLEGRLWLFRAGLTETIIRQYSIGYSEHLRRVILPVYSTQGDLIWYQCRAVHTGQKPKYIQPSRGRDGVLFLVTPSSNTGNSIVVVEDILSAIRVGEHTTTCSLLGTKLTTEQAEQLSRYTRVTTWLDPDRAGRDGAYNIRRTLGLVTEVSNIMTDRDPKLMSDQEIEEELCKLTNI